MTTLNFVPTYKKTLVTGRQFEFNIQVTMQVLEESILLWKADS